MAVHVSIYFFFAQLGDGVKKMFYFPKKMLPRPIKWNAVLLKASFFQLSELYLVYSSWEGPPMDFCSKYLTTGTVDNLLDSADGVETVKIL